MEFEEWDREFCEKLNSLNLSNLTMKEQRQSAWQAATERAAGIAENESLFSVDDTWVEASDKIAQKIRGE